MFHHIFQHGLGIGTDVGVHQGVRVVKIRNGWFQTCDFRVHGLK